MINELLLLPFPRQLDLSGERLSLVQGGRIFCDSADFLLVQSAVERLQKAMADGLGWAWEATVGQAVPGQPVALVLAVLPERNEHPQGYRLAISPDGISIEAGDAAGAFYAVCTLIQILEAYGQNLPCLHIRDWPDFPVRGVMLDVSRDKVPTLETLFDLVDLLAGWKINQLQLYMEHTFAYPSHPEVWAQASPFTGEEIETLDTYCRQRHIELVPNQNSFGHMHRWLSHPRYASLAEISNGFETPWGRMEGSFSLCPVDPESLLFLDGLYDELLPKFSSPLFNVGCDETFDLGQGRSREICAARGSGRVYLDFLLQIYELVRRRGRTMQYWGDILLQHPEFIPELPKDAIALEWGYEADHPFAEHCARFAAAGVPFYVCPGTSSWSSIAGRTSNALGNLLNAAENGLRCGAAGYLITDWGDNGHWQPLPVSYLGFSAGAAFSWALEPNRGLDVRRSLSWHAFRDPSCSLGSAAFELGEVYQAYGLAWENTSILWATLQRSFAQIRIIKKVKPDGYRRCLEAIDRALLPLEFAQSTRPDRELILREFRLAGWMMRHACWRGLLALEAGDLDQEALPHRLDADMGALIAEYRQVWLARNRAGGLEDSVARFEKSRRDYQVKESF